MSALALLGHVGNIPTYYENWEKLIGKFRKQEELSEAERKETELSFLQARSEWLLHKIMLLDLILAFSREHKYPAPMTEHCEKERPRALDELRGIERQIQERA
jgi:hypothetical protein